MKKKTKPDLDPRYDMPPARLCATALILMAAAAALFLASMVALAFASMIGAAVCALACFWTLGLCSLVLHSHRHLELKEWDSERKYLLAEDSDKAP